MRRTAFLTILGWASLTVWACGHQQPSHRHDRHCHTPHCHTPHCHTPHCHTARHRFQNAEQWARRFDDPRRDQWQKPDAVIGKLALAAGSKVADIGAGTGYFTVRLAKALPKGLVYGLDVEESMVRYLRQRARKAGLGNVKAHQIPFEDPRLPAGVDVVFLCNTYHHIDKRTAYFRKVAAQLGPKGRLVIVDFKGGKLPFGPPERDRVLPPAIDKELLPAGFSRLELDETTLPYQFILVYQRGARSTR